VSFVTQLEQAILVAAATARPDLTTALGAIQHSSIPAGSFPYAYTDAFLRTQAATEEGTVTTYAGLLVIVGEGGSDEAGNDAALEAVREIAEAVDAALAADVTLGGLITSVLVSIDSFPDPTSAHFVAVLAFEIDPGAAGGGGSATGAISWQLETTVVLVTTTVAAWEADRAAAIVAALGAGAARFDSDLADPPVESVPAGTARFALSITADVGIISSNVNGTALDVTLRVFHALALAATERSYTMGPMIAQMLTFAAREFWTGPFVDARIANDGDPEISELTR